MVGPESSATNTAGTIAIKGPKLGMKFNRPAIIAKTSHILIPILAKPIAVKRKTTIMAKNFPFSHFFKFSPNFSNISLAFCSPFWGISCTIPFLYTCGETVKKIPINNTT